MKKIDRRSFIWQAAAGTGALVFPWSRGSGNLVAETVAGFSAADKVKFGSSGLVASRLALGTGTHGIQHSSNQTKMKRENFIELVRHGFERGINFWDSADQYGSHECFRQALKYIPREKVVILTKSGSRDAENMRKDIDRFRSELGTDTIDIFLLHCMTDPQWPEKMKPVIEVLNTARENGHIRSLGVSCHDLGALKAAARSPWTEVILARINHRGVAMDAAPEYVVPVLKEAHENGKMVVGMKIVGVGRLKDQIDQSLRFVLGLGVVDAMTIGFESVTELDQVIEKIAAVKT